MKGIIDLERKLPSEKGSIKFSNQSLERARFRDTFPSLNVIQTGSKYGGSPDAPPYDQRCIAASVKIQLVSSSVNQQLVSRN